MTQPIKVQSFWMPLLALSGLTLFAYFASPVLVPLVAALFFAFLLSPLIDLLQRLKVPYALAVTIVMLIFLAAFVLVLWWGAVQVAALVQKAPQYQEALVKALADLSARLPAGASDYFPFLKDPHGWVPTFAPQDVGKILQFTTRGIGSATSFLGSAFLVYFLTFFMLLDRESMQRRLTYFFGREHRATTADIVKKINRAISGFLVVKTAITIVLGFVLTIGFMLLQIPLPLLWGPLAAILNWIPYLGSLIAFILTAGATFAAHGFSWHLPVLAAFFLIVQTLEGNIIGPKILETKIDLNPMAVLVSAIFWAWIWGFAGALLAIPITAAFKVVCDHVEALQPFGILLGGKKHE
ncbi:MAG: AI-2E family transporter [candidate division Zixibacteria bacterium]|nr:AI-2E family transporter [candidate division Zixibacteria bacterium]